MGEQKESLSLSHSSSSKPDIMGIGYMVIESCADQFPSFVPPSCLTELERRALVS